MSWEGEGIIERVMSLNSFFFRSFLLQFNFPFLSDGLLIAVSSNEVSLVSVSSITCVIITENIKYDCFETFDYKPVLSVVFAPLCNFAYSHTSLYKNKF